MRNQKPNYFICINCQKQVFTRSERAGTAHRNHCPFCLFSRHLDLKKPGDRMARCGEAMVPIGLTFKEEEPDKYSKPGKGEIMLVHRCLAGDKITVNRIAADDDPQKILEALKSSENVQDLSIELADMSDEEEIKTQLFGKP